MKKILTIIISTLFLLSCKEKEIRNDNKDFLTKITYSNLVDSDIQNKVRDILIDNNVSEKQADIFLKSVNLFNNGINDYSLVDSGFKKLDGIKADYNEFLMQEKWNSNFPLFSGFNCRITSYTLMSDLIKVNSKEIGDTDYLFIDKDSIKNTPIDLFDENQTSNFFVLFSTVPTTLTKDYKVHVKNIQDEFKKRKIEFTDSKIKLISVFFHEQEEENNYLFIGHIGVLLPYEDKFLFIEKIAFQEPYQAILFNDKTELNDYLMGKYDVNFNQPTADPIIMENDKLLDTYRFNPNKGEL